jgi:hypothetical protein
MKPLGLTLHEELSIDRIAIWEERAEDGVFLREGNTLQKRFISLR